jgi:transglutaminase-like putative cysteine protease
MLRHLTLPGALVLAVAALAARAGAEGPPHEVYAIPLHTRHFVLTYTAEIPAFPPEARAVDLWLPVARSDEHQALRLERVDLDAARCAAQSDATDPRTGNEYRHYRFEAPFPPAARVTLTYDVVRREYLKKDFRGRGAAPLSAEERALVAPYLAPDRLVPTGGKIGEIARRLAGGESNVLNLGRRFYDHVLGTMRYDKSGEGWGRGDALWACESGRGNCTDFHALFIALCRSQGIAARFAIGLPLPEKHGRGEIPGYHCWAEFYVPAYGWVPVDISEAGKHPELAEYYFGAHNEDRIELARGRDLRLVPAQQGEPLNFFVYPYAEADGKAWDGVRHAFSYEDRP